MKTIYTKTFQFSASDHKIKHDLTVITVSGFALPEESKLVNTLLNDRVITEKQMDGILVMLADVEQRVSAKREQLKTEYDIENLPEQAPPNSIILRPKEFFNFMLENYDLHIARVKELAGHLVTETRDDEDDNE